MRFELHTPELIIKNKKIFTTIRWKLVDDFDVYCEDDFMPTLPAYQAYKMNLLYFYTTLEISKYKSRSNVV